MRFLLVSLKLQLHQKKIRLDIVVLLALLSVVIKTMNGKLS